MEEWLSWRPGRFIPDTSLLGCWVWPKGGLEGWEMRCISSPHRELNHDYLVQFVAHSLYELYDSEIRIKKIKNKTIHTRPNQEAPCVDFISPSSCFMGTFIWQLS